MGTQFGYKQAQLGTTETTETNLGDIEAPMDVSRITGIFAQVALETGTAGDGAVGWARLSFLNSEELDGIPISIVCREDIGQGFYAPEYIPVNIPVSGLVKIHCFMTLSVAQGGVCVGLVSLRFE